MINLFKRLFGPPDIAPHTHMRNMQGANNIGRSENVKTLSYLEWDIPNKLLNLSEDAFELLGVPEGSNPALTDLKDICHPEDVKQVCRIIDIILFKKKFPDFYCRIITANHNIKHIFVTGEVILDNANQSVTSIKALLQDVTEQRLHIQKIHMQSRNLEDIAWLQSHKMRSPVATIMGLIQLFNSENINDPINIKILEGIKEAAVNLDDTIKEINSKTDTMKVVS